MFHSEWLVSKYYYVVENSMYLLLGLNVIRQWMHFMDKVL